MSTVVPMNVEKNGGSSSSSSSSNCAKILAGVLFLSTVGLAIVLGVVLASDDDNDSLTSASVTSETIYKEFGELQTWKQLGGSYNNTNYLPASAPLAPAAVRRIFILNSHSLQRVI